MLKSQSPYHKPQVEVFEHPRATPIPDFESMHIKFAEELEARKKLNQPTIPVPLNIATTKTPMEHEELNKVNQYEAKRKGIEAIDARLKKILSTAPN